MNTIPTSLLTASSMNPPEPIKLTPEEKRRDELFQMAIHGTFAPGVTAKDLAAAKWKVEMDLVDLGGGEYGHFPIGNGSILHEAARFGHYPPDTTLELMAETVDAENTTALEIAMLICRDCRIPLPRCCTGPALSRLQYRSASRSWLHCAMAYELTPPDTTPELLINTSHEGWTALHAAADSGHVIPGTTLRMLKKTITPATGPSVANFSAWDAFKEQVDRALADLANDKIPLSKAIINSTKNLLRASIAFVPNLESLAEVHNLAKVFQKIAPVETALWFAAELAGHQQRFVDADKATVPKGQIGNAGKDGQGVNEFPCPKCGGKMAVRTATTGKNKGNQFLGCAAYPKCKSMRTLDGNIISV